MGPRKDELTKVLIQATWSPETVNKFEYPLMYITFPFSNLQAIHSEKFSQVRNHILALVIHVLLFHKVMLVYGFKHFVAPRVYYTAILLWLTVLSDAFCIQEWQLSKWPTKINPNFYSFSEVSRRFTGWFPSLQRDYIGYIKLVSLREANWVLSVFELMVGT